MSGHIETPVNEHITLTCFNPEYRDAMEKALEGWCDHLVKLERIKPPGDPVYSFAYWLFRYSGLIVPKEATEAECERLRDAIKSAFDSLSLFEGSAEPESWVEHARDTLRKVLEVKVE
jgi:hypothetical protein